MDEKQPVGLKKLLFVISSLKCGGAQRVMTILANYWAERGWHITLINFSEEKDEAFFELHPQVNVRCLHIATNSMNMLHGVFNNLKRVWILRKAIQQTSADVIVSFMDRTNVLSLLATLGLKVPVIVSERNSPAKKPMGGWIWTELRRILYPKATRVVLQSQDAVMAFPLARHWSTCVIPNPVQALKRPSNTVLDSSDKTKNIVALGRLRHQKGFDLLIKAFAQISPQHPEWRLVIWGEGQYRPYLEALISKLKMEAYVQLPGRTEHAFDVLCKADLFVLSSRYEGFPNALCEAMTCGLPVISFDCPHGPKDIIRDGIDGLLVPAEDVCALAKSMKHLMTEVRTREQMAKRASEVIDRFSVETVARKWESLIKTITETP